MKVFIIDHYEGRGKAISLSINKEGRVINYLKAFPTDEVLLQSCLSTGDLFLLHVGPNNAVDLDIAIDRLAEKPVLCITGGTNLKIEIRAKSQDNLWCYCKYQIHQAITQEEFIASDSGKSICRYLQRIQDGVMGPLDAKNEFQRFSLKLEGVLEELYEGLRNGKSAENIITERDAYFNSDEYLNSEMASR